MKIATEAQARSLANPLLQTLKKLREISSIVVVAIVGVRSGHDVRGSILRRHAAHLLGDFPRLRPVVHFRQDMTMDINHAAGIKTDSATRDKGQSPA